MWQTYHMKKTRDAKEAGISLAAKLVGKVSQQILNFIGALFPVRPDHYFHSPRLKARGNTERYEIGERICNCSLERAAPSPSGEQKGKNYPDGELFRFQ